MGSIRERKQGRNKTVILFSTAAVEKLVDKIPNGMAFHAFMDTLKKKAARRNYLYCLYLLQKHNARGAMT